MVECYMLMSKDVKEALESSKDWHVCECVYQKSTLAPCLCCWLCEHLCHDIAEEHIYSAHSRIKSEAECESTLTKPVPSQHHGPYSQSFLE